MSVTCPICHKDDSIQRLSVIESSGISSGTFTGYSDGYTSVSGTAKTNLARQLASPSAPTRSTGCEGGIIVAALIIGVILFFVIVLFIGTNPTPGSILLLAVFGVIGFLAVSANAKKGGDNYSREKPIWDKAIAKWNSLYFCHRDGIVFDPNTQKTCQPEDLQNFLNS